ncbi:hypothetical protein [Muricoccus radiodurans]|uniref:hypothetical protein n=1 Tax=Muricoccus radiodurans TaxID=2231721 RepID=UPI003CE79675
MRRALPFLAPLLLAACVSTSRDQAASVLAEVLASHQASIAGLNAPSTPPAPAEGAPRPTGRAPGAVAALLGQTPDGVLGTLGRPTLRRPEGTAEIWLYQGQNCAVDVILYRAGNAGPRVAWAAARASGTESRTEAACLREVAGQA